MRFILASLILLALPIPLRACLWDEDTLASEAKGLPDVVQVITGRFERNPPLYYEMRLDRVAKRIESHPDDLAASDDAGVACDRLGRDDEAIAWMEKKRAVLERADPSSPAIRDHRYRYLANLGTFWVHRWVRSGADRKRIDEVKTARDFIAKAIELNPDAHFGREKYQLRAMDWIIDGPVAPKSKLSYEHKPKPRSFYDPSDPSTPPAEAVRGLTGLIVLGNAWESVDIFNALTVALKADHERSSIAFLSSLRCAELVRNGRHSLSPDPDTDRALRDRELPGNWVKGEDNLRAAYLKLKDNAEDWNLMRAEYMMDRLKSGRHPDTDPAFWKNYHDWGIPSLSDVEFAREADFRSIRGNRIRQGIGLVAAFVGGLVVASLVGGLVLWRIRRPQRVIRKSRALDPLA